MKLCKCWARGSGSEKGRASRTAEWGIHCLQEFAFVVICLRRRVTCENEHASAP